MDTNRASEANVNKQISSIILFLTSSTDLFLSRISLLNFGVNTSSQDAYKSLLAKELTKIYSTPTPKGWQEPKK